MSRSSTSAPARARNAPTGARAARSRRTHARAPPHDARRHRLQARYDAPGSGRVEGEARAIAGVGAELLLAAAAADAAWLALDTHEALSGIKDDLALPARGRRSASCAASRSGSRDAHGPPRPLSGLHDPGDVSSRAPRLRARPPSTGRGSPAASTGSRPARVRLGRRADARAGAAQGARAAEDDAHVRARAQPLTRGAVRRGSRRAE